MWQINTAASVDQDQTHLLSGKIEIPSDLVISSIAQDPSFLKGPMTAYAEGEGLDISLFLAILAKLGLTKEHFERPMGIHESRSSKKRSSLQLVWQSRRTFIFTMNL